MGNWFSRFTEPSTWAGFAVLLSLFGVQVGMEEASMIGAGVAAVGAVVMREKGQK